VTYTPDIRNYQQIPLGGPTGPFDCNPWCGAILVDAHSAGKVKTTGRKLRLASDEPKPDPHSPGLNLPQVDAAIRAITPFDFDTRLGDTILDAETRIRDGRWASIQVVRGVLVDHGYGGPSTFRGTHEITVHCNPGDPTPVIGDPLVPHYMRASWSVIWRAAAGITGAGRVNAMFTRDLIPEYTATIRPTPPATQRRFHVFHVTAGRIVRREVNVTRGFTRPCTPPRFYPWPGHAGRSLVELTAGDRKGLYVRSEWAKEV
jgi:hypothetical protein